MQIIILISIIQAYNLDNIDSKLLSNNYLSIIILTYLYLFRKEKIILLY